MQTPAEVIVAVRQYLNLYSWQIMTTGLSAEWKHLHRMWTSLVAEMPPFVQCASCTVP